ncbi:MAG: hypothetical protein ACK56F_27490, partial [bacterium]
ASLSSIATFSSAQIGESVASIGPEYAKFKQTFIDHQIDGSKVMKLLKGGENMELALLDLNIPVKPAEVIGQKLNLLNGAPIGASLMVKDGNVDFEHAKFNSTADVVSILNSSSSK